MRKQLTFKGDSITLVGRNIEPGSSAPDFQVVSAELQDTSLKDFRGKIKIITTFPSLDTPVCDLQLKEFNKMSVDLSPDIVVVGISKDLPFAQKRFCETNNIKNVTVLSDYKSSSFGINYGLLIKELNLLARSILIIDKNDSLRYIQIVQELTSSPDYKEALNSIKEVVKTSAVAESEISPLRCKPCEGGVSSLAKEKINVLLLQHKGWELIEGKKIAKKFKFKDFIEAKYFLDIISVIAQEQGHHPVLTLIYDVLKVTLTTHAAKGLTENDFIMAEIIDEIMVS